MGEKENGGRSLARGTRKGEKGSSLTQPDPKGGRRKILPLAREEETRDWKEKE